MTFLVWCMHSFINDPGVVVGGRHKDVDTFFFWTNAKHKRRRFHALSLLQTPCPNRIWQQLFSNMNSSWSSCLQPAKVKPCEWDDGATASSKYARPFCQVRVCVVIVFNWTRMPYCCPSR